MANEFGANIPVFAVDPQGQGRAFGEDIPEFGTVQQQGSPAAARPTFGQDIARSAMAGAAQGVPELLGLPGTIGQLSSAAARSAATPTEQDGRFYVPSMSPGGFGQMREIPAEQAQRMQSGQPNMVQRAISYVNPFTYLPSGQQVKEFAAEKIPGYREAMEYQPSTGPGVLVKGAMKELPTAALPFGGPLIGRVGGALGAGASAEAAREAYPESMPIQMGAALLGGLGGSFGAQYGSQFASAPFRRAEPTARQVLEQQFKRDLAEAAPTERATRLDVLRQAATSGVSPDDIAPVSLLGDRGRKMISSLGLSSDDVSTLNQTIARSQQAAPDNVARDIAALVRRPSPVSYTKEQALLADVKNSINNPAYRIVMSSPEASSIPNSLYADVAGYELFRRELPNIMAKIEPMKGRLDIVPPDFRTNSPGNLAFWDFAKKHFDVMGDTERAMRDSYREIAKQIRQSSDIAVPSYAGIRDRAAELIGYENAMKLGYDMTSMTNRRFAALKPNEIGILKNMPSAERSNMRLGIIGGLTDRMVTPSGAADVQRIFKDLRSPEMQRRLSYAFSPEEIGDIYGTAARNAMIAKAAPIRAGETSREAVEAFAQKFGNPAMGAAGGVLANVLFQQSLMNFDWTHAAALVGGAIYGKAVNAAQRRTTEQLLRMINDPNQTVELGRTLAQSPLAASIYSRMNDLMTDNLAVVAAARSQLAVEKPRPLTTGDGQLAVEEPRPLTIPGGQRAAGGRVGRASGGRINPEAMADRIIGQIDRARKELQNETSALLNHDDQTVVKALKVANERI
jgi:hypothetical protein